MKRHNCLQSFTPICATILAVCIFGCGRKQTEQTATNPKPSFEDAIVSLANNEFPPQHSLLIYQNDELAFENY